MRAQAEAKHLVFRFANIIEVRESDFLITKNGARLPLEPKAFKVLLYLLHHPSHTVTKDELLNAVWSDAAVTENSLTRAIALLRHVLGDDPHEQRFIETVATVGYRFVCPVEVVEDAANYRDGQATGGVTLTPEADGVSALPQPSGNEDSDATTSMKPLDRRNWVFRRWWWLLTGAVVLGLAAGIWHLSRPLPSPRIAGYRQLTHDGQDRVTGGTDGSRVYFTQMSPRSIGQVAVTGGEVASIRVDLPDGPPALMDVSPDGSSLLLRSKRPGQESRSLWIVAILGGSLRRLGAGLNGAFSPDGNSVAYSTQQGEIWLARIDGSGNHKLVSPGETADFLSWSPDGRTIRFFRGYNSLWEVASNGTNVRHLLSGWHSSSWMQGGKWTSDGRFYLFLSGEGGYYRSQIWALDERRGLFRKPPIEPIQLTHDPIIWDQPISSKDGKEIFAEGRTARGELHRFDTGSGEFKPYLGGISAEFVDFSKDGKSIAYVSFPGGVLWKANRDGSNRVQLTEPPLYPLNPRWSPDGTKILFFDRTLQGYPVMYFVSSEGGVARRLLSESEQMQGDPTWSPDGHRIVFTAGVFRDREKQHLEILDLDTHQVTSVPASAGEWSPRWSPDGRYIAALSWNSPVLRIYDLKTERWSAMPIEGDVSFPGWSSDGQFIYSLLTEGNAPSALVRVRIAGRKVERIFDLKDWHLTGWSGYSLTLDPTDAPLILREMGSNDIYALSLVEK